jgi:chromate transporter
MHKTKGGIVAGLLFVLPSLFILILLTWMYIAFGQTTLIIGLFYGIKPAVVAIVAQAAHRIGSRALKNTYLWLIAATASIGSLLLELPFPLIVCLAALIGFLGGRYYPEKFSWELGIVRLTHRMAQH